MALSPDARPPVRTFKPRRRRVPAERAAAYERLLPQWSLDEHGPLLDVGAVFGRIDACVLDVGIGMGEATVALAVERPTDDVIAVDVHTPGIARVLEALEQHGLTNVRVVHGDALEFLHRLPAASLAGVRVWFPDPWPKRRQHHKRLVRPDVVAALTDRLRPGGVLHLATDVADYARQMAQVCDAEARLEGGPVTRPEWRPETRYELRGRREGRTAVDLVYRRRVDPPAAGR